MGLTNQTRANSLKDMLTRRLERVEGKLDSLIQTMHQYVGVLQKLDQRRSELAIFRID